MSELGPFGAGGPFEDIMRNLARLFTSSGPVNWDVARQFAQWAATGGTPEANADPLARVRLEELARVAELHVNEFTGLALSGGGLPSVRTFTAGQWALRSLEAWKPLLEAMAASMGDLGTLGGGGPAEVGDPASDPMAQLFSNLPQMLGPFLFGMQSGSMVGQLGSRALGDYDLPMPRPPSDELAFVPAAMDTFAAEWGLAVDDVALWVSLREVTYHAVLGRAAVRNRLDELIGAYVSAFQPDPSAIEERLRDLDPTDMVAMQSLFGDPAALLGELQSPAQRQAQKPLQALLCALTGYVDHVMASVGDRLLPSFGALTEALHRRRLEDSGGAALLGRLFGVELDAAAYERGQTFVAGVVEREGNAGLARLWRSAKSLPTPAEIDAPGLWLARLEFDEEPPQD